jgi:hypothetical protein
VGVSVSRGPRFVYQGDDLAGKFLVTWDETKAHRTATVFYQGWQQQYGEPMYSPNRKDALLMGRSGAYRAAKRLQDIARWGVDARIVAADDCA